MLKPGTMCIHLTSDIVSTPALRVTKLDGTTHYVCPVCYLEHTSDPARSHKNFVTKRLTMPKKLERELVTLYKERVAEMLPKQYQALLSGEFVDDGD